MPPKKKIEKKKHNVLEDGFFKKGEKTFVLEKAYNTKSEAEKHLKIIRAEGFLGELSEYSSKKHKNPYFVFKGPKGKAHGGGRKTGPRRINYQQGIVSSKGKIKKLAKEYVNLPSNLKIRKSNTRKRRDKYRSKKKLTPNQKKILQGLEKEYKILRDQRKLEVKIKKEMVEEKEKLKHFEQKKKEAEKKEEEERRQKFKK